MKQVKTLPLTEECHHWTEIAEVPWDLQKYASSPCPPADGTERLTGGGPRRYWQQRYTIFPYYDDGVHLTHDAWYGVTPEPVATRIARDLPELVHDGKTTLVDLFAGVGANTIAFALSGRWDHIIAIERDAATLACAQHNAQLYGVSEFITWVHGDNFDFLHALQSDYDSLDDGLQIDVTKTVLFGSPPWGGPGYRTDNVFDLSGMEPYNLDKMHTAYRAMDHALYLPRTSDLRQIAKLAPPGEKIEVVQYCVEGASKALVAYIPAARA